MSVGIPRPKYATECLIEMAQVIGLDDAQSQVFVVRFDPKNLNKQSSALGDRYCKDAVDPKQTWIDRVKQSIEALDKYYDGAPSIKKGKSGRPKKGEEKWRKTYEWLWVDHYPVWEESYLERSPVRLLAQLLLNLDIHSQRQNFADAITAQPISSFYLEVDGPTDTAKNWVIASLLKNLPKTSQKTCLMPLKAPTYFESLDWFWDGLVEYFPNELDQRDDDNDLQARLIDLCLTRTQERPCCLVVSLNRCSSELMSQLLNQFWAKIVNHPHADRIPFGHCFVFLLVGGNNALSLPDVVDCQIFEDVSQLGINKRSIMLNPIRSIQGHDVVQWLQDKGDVLIPLMSQKYHRFGQEVKGWDKSEAINKSPLAVLFQICEHADFNDGLAAVETYWKCEAIG